jgi:hypothetical protein
LEPYALRASRKILFDPCFLPADPQDDIIVGSPTETFKDEDACYNWPCVDPIIRDDTPFPWCDPAGFSRFAHINEAYMSGFRNRAAVDQARIHLITACLELGHFEDEAVTKNLLKMKAMELWTRAWLRSEKKFFPSPTELDAAFKRIPPNVADKFHWSDAFRDLGLLDIPSLGEQDYTPGPGVFYWMMRSDPDRQDAAGLLDALQALNASIVCITLL